MTRRRLRASIAVLAFTACPLATAPAAPLLWQTNSEGDDIHVFDLERQQLVRRLVVGPQPHGIAAPADARVVYVTLEANGRPQGELLWIDPLEYTIRHRMEICREPHALATTPDRRLALLSPMGEAARVTVVDLEAGHEVVGEIAFAASVRPPALSDDGRLFQHVDGLSGFQVADVARGEVVATVEHGAPLGWLLVHPRLGWLGPSGLQRCLGLAVRPGHHEVWSTCGASVTIHDIEDSTYPELARVPLDSKAYWLTFSPDGRWALVALSGAEQVAVVDAESRDVVAQLSTGPGPKRNLVIDLDQVAGTLSGEALP